MIPIIIGLLEATALAEELIWVRTVITTLKGVNTVMELTSVMEAMTKERLPSDPKLKDETIQGESTLFATHALSLIKKMNDDAGRVQFDTARMISFASAIISAPRLKFANASAGDKTRAYLKVLNDAMLKSFPEHYDQLVKMTEESRKKYFTSSIMRQVVSDNVYAPIIQKVYMAEVDHAEIFSAEANDRTPSGRAAVHLTELLKHEGSSLGRFLDAYVLNNKKINQSQSILSGLVGYLRQRLNHNSGTIVFEDGTPITLNTSVLPSINIYPHKPMSLLSQTYSMTKLDVDEYAGRLNALNRNKKGSKSLIVMDAKELAEEKKEQIIIKSGSRTKQFK